MSVAEIKKNLMQAAFFKVVVLLMNACTQSEAAALAAITEKR